MRFLSNKKYSAMQVALGQANAQVQLLSMDPREDEDTTYTGNSFKEQKTGIQALDKKFNGKADWGCQLVCAIIGVRAAFIAGKGVQVAKSTDDKGDNELAFAKSFFDTNGLMSEVSIQWVQEAEIEARALAQLIFDKNKAWTDTNGAEQTGMVRAQLVPWLAYRYTVETADGDYQRFVKVKGRDDTTQKEFIRDEKDFIYRPFGGRIAKPNEPVPKLLPVLTQVESLDKALRDWRQINHLFCGPTPTVQMPNEATQEEIDAFAAMLNEIKWKIGKMLVLKGEFSMVTPTLTGVESLLKEITTLAKIISGATGVPVHFLGLPDLMSNRATADNLMELVWAATTRERQIWTGFYQEMLDKAIEVWNAKSQRTPLIPGLVTVSIPDISEDALEKITSLYLPLAVAGKLSDETLLSKLPDIDVQEELARIKAQKKENMGTFGGNLFEQNTAADVDGEDEKANAKKKENQNGGKPK